MLNTPHRPIEDTYDSFLGTLKSHLADITDESIVTDLEQFLVTAKNYDFYKTAQLLSKPFSKLGDRNFNMPIHFSNPKLKGQSWADNKENYLEDNEHWNIGRRETYMSIDYHLDIHGRPINPYMNYGITGRGFLGRFGPNHTVDVGVLRVMPNEKGEQRLHALGIIRGDNHKPALCGGFIEFDKESAMNGYTLDKRLIVQTRVEEFFEEMISGSVELRVAYSEGLGDELQREMNKYEVASGCSITDQEKVRLERYLRTQRKLKQVREFDPQFMSRLKLALAEATEVFKGPVLSSSRNTNTSWVETNLSWIELTDQKWQEIKGNNIWSRYDFVAGDDALDVQWFEINAELISKASSSHGAFFFYLLQSYMAAHASKNKALYSALHEQAEAIQSALQAGMNKPEARQTLQFVNERLSLIL